MPVITRLKLGGRKPRPETRGQYIRARLADHTGISREVAIKMLGEAFDYNKRVMVTIGKSNARNQRKGQAQDYQDLTPEARVVFDRYRRGMFAKEWRGKRVIVLCFLLFRKPEDWHQLDAFLRLVRGNRRYWRTFINLSEWNNGERRGNNSSPQPLP